MIYKKTGDWQSKGKSSQKKQGSKRPVLKKSAQKETSPKFAKVSLTEVTPGKAEITLKISSFPKIVREYKHRHLRFHLDIGGNNPTVRYVRLTVRPRIFNRIMDALKNYPNWMAVLKGKIGPRIPFGFVLKDPNINVVEKKPKEGETPAIVKDPSVEIMMWDKNPGFVQIVPEETVPAVCELAVKINQIPIAKDIENGWKEFDVDIGGGECSTRFIRIAIRPKTWNKLTEAQQKYPYWTAVITGKPGEKIIGGFKLENPGLGVKESSPPKPKKFGSITGTLPEKDIPI